MDAALRQIVRLRAGNRCEYCQLCERYSSTPFQFDHVIAEQHHGRTLPGNLAFACLADNNHKGPNLGGIDAKTGKRVWLYNPRRQKWHRHFRWNGPVLEGKTPVGRATIAVLAINLPHRIAQRVALIAEGVFPPRSVC